MNKYKRKFRIDGGVSVAAGGFGGTIGGTSAPAGAASSSGSSSGSTTSATIPGGSSGSGSGNQSSGGTSGSSTGIVVSFDNNGNGGGSSTDAGGITAPAYNSNSGNGYIPNVSNNEEEFVLIDGIEEAIATEDLITAIMLYYNLDSVEGVDVGLLSADPSFVQYLKKKVKRASKKKLSLADLLKQEPDNTEGDEEEETPGQINTSNTWTLFGVTMKKNYWLFIAGGLVLLLTTIVTLAITKKK